MIRHCNDCQFGRGFGDDGEGVCRRYPPIYLGGDDHYDDHAWASPVVIAGFDWCGEWKPMDDDLQLERARRIATAILKGKRIKDVAESYGISASRTMQIVIRWCQKTNPSLCASDPDPHKSTTTGKPLPQLRFLRAHADEFLRKDAKGK